MHKSSKCDITKYVTPCLYHTLWWNGWCDIIKVRLYEEESNPPPPREIKNHCNKNLFPINAHWIRLILGPKFVSLRRLTVYEKWITYPDLDHIMWVASKLTFPKIVVSHKTYHVTPIRCEFTTNTWRLHEHATLASCDVIYINKLHSRRCNICEVWHEPHNLCNFINPTRSSSEGSKRSGSPTSIWSHFKTRHVQAILFHLRSLALWTLEEQ